MPNDIPELDDYQKEKEEFSEAVDDVLSADEDKTDEEIIAEMDKKHADKPDEGGEPIKDPETPLVPDTPAADDSDGVDTDGQEITPATPVIEDPPDTIEAWKSKAGDLEAELTKERQKTSSWNGRITAANNKVKDLEAKIVELESQAKTVGDKDTKASTDSDNEVLERLRSDFPELSTAFDILQKRIDGVTQTPAKADTLDTSTSTASNDDDAATLEAEQKKVREEHLAAIRKEHSDLPEMVNSGVLLSWINSQPESARSILETIYRTGKAEQVIKMVTDFKNDTGWKSSLKPAGDTKTAAQAKLDAMREVQSQSYTPDGKIVDKQDYDQGAKDAGL